MSKLNNHLVGLHGKTCFGCGPENEFGLKIKLTFDESVGEVVGDYKIPDKFCSANGLIHGGIIATILDESQGLLCQCLGYPVMTKKLEVEYKKFITKDNTANIRAWLSNVDKRNLETQCIINNENNELIASSVATWYIFPERLWRKFWSFSKEDADIYSEYLNNNKIKAKLIRKKLSAQEKAKNIL